MARWRTLMDLDGGVRVSITYRGIYPKQRLVIAKHWPMLRGGQEQIDFLTQNDPVIRSDADLVETDEIVEARLCVRATDEDFPADVEPAWVLISEVRDNRKLAAKVIFEDQEVLKDKNDN